MSAVLTGITNVVRANIAGAAQRAVKSAASDVRSIAGLNPSGSNSALGATTNLMGGTSSNILSYPLAVDTDPQQGHYVLFHINTRINGKLLTPKTKKEQKAAVDRILRNNGLKAPAGGRGNGAAELAARRQMQQQLIDGSVVSNKVVDKNPETKSFALSKVPTKRLEKSIALYMPPSISVDYEVKYGEEKIGAVAMASQQMIDAIAGSGATFDTFLEGLATTGKGAVKEGLMNVVNKSADAVAPGTKALFSLARGSVITPRMEMMFEGVGRRSFSYTFNFIPKSQQEALVVEDIIQHFKFYAMPKYSNPNTRREMDIPGTFDIEYMYRENRNNFLNRISTCYLKSVKVQYGGDRFTAYEETTSLRGSGAPPQRSQISLEFTELEILSQDHIKDGF